MALVSTSTRALLSAGLQLGQDGDAVHAGQLEVEQDDVRGELGGQRERGGAVAGLAGHLDPVLHLEQDPQARRTTGWSSTISTEMGPRHWLPHRLAFPGTVIRTVVPFAAGPDGQRAAGRRGALAHRGQPEAAGRRLGHEPVPVVGHLEHDQARRLGQGDRDAGRAGVPQRVVQRLLRHPVERGLGRRSSGGKAAAVNATGTPCARPASAA